MSEDEEESVEEGLDAVPAGELSTSLKERLLTAWENREPKWYERLAPAQKHWVDKLVAIRLDEFYAHLTELDQEDSQLARQIAELTTQIIQLNRRLASLEERLDRLEAD